MLELPAPERRKAIRLLPPRVRADIPYTWALWGRPDQIWAPGDELWTVAECGRGWGKTRWAIEATKLVARHPELCGGRPSRGPGDRTCGRGGIIGIAGRTAGDTRENLLFGPSGLITNSPPSFRPVYEPMRARLVWPNGVIARLFSGDEPRQFLGANLGFLLLDELANWYSVSEAIPMLELTLRHGDRPRGVIATTPVAEDGYLRFLYEFGDDGAPLIVDGALVPRPNVRVIHGATYDNAANLAPEFLVSTVRRFEGTTLGDEQLRGIVSLEVKSAIWRRAWIHRVAEAPELVAVAILVDPAVSDDDEGAETGIIVAGRGRDGDLYLLDDASGHYTEGEWSDLVVALAYQHDADEIAAEDNNGGNLVKAAIVRAIERARDQRSGKGDRLARAGRRARVRLVHATVDKVERASNVVHLWEHGHAHHVGDPRKWVRLEHQLTTFDPHRAGARTAKRKRKRADGRGMSDRMDAAVWAALVLLGDGTDRRAIQGMTDRQAWAKIAEQVRRNAGARRGTTNRDASVAGARARRRHARAAG